MAKDQSAVVGGGAADNDPSIVNDRSSNGVLLDILHLIKYYSPVIPQCYICFDVFCLVEIKTFWARKQNILYKLECSSHTCLNGEIHIQTPCIS